MSALFLSAFWYRASSAEPNGACLDLLGGCIDASSQVLRRFASGRRAESGSVAHRGLSAATAIAASMKGSSA